MMLASAYLSPGDGVEFSREAEREFFRNIKTSNGTKKSTAPRRLDAMNNLYFATIERRGMRPSVAMDIGVSSGVTTLEWLREFEKRELPVTIMATDLVMSVDIHSIGRHMRVLTEKNGHLLQIEIFGRGIRAHIRGRDYVTGGILWRKALYRIAQVLLKKGVHQGTYQLVAPALRGQERIRLFDDDIFAPNLPQFTRCADVVRVANLIQPIYFSDRQIRIAVENIRERCRGEGSMVVVCRNTDDGLEGSILRMTAGRRLVSESRLSHGSEVEDYFTAEPRRGD